MRKVIFLFATVFILTNTFGSVSVTEPRLNAATIMIPIGKTGKQISLLQLSTIGMEELQTLTGKKMNFIQRIEYKTAQKKLRKAINADGYIDNKKMNKLFSKSATGNTEGFHALGFLLGFLLGLIGVLLAYVINDDEDKRNRVKWAWIGCATFLVLWIILVAVVFASAGVI